MSLGLFSIKTINNLQLVIAIGAVLHLISIVILIKKSSVRRQQYKFTKLIIWKEYLYTINTIKNTYDKQKCLNMFEVFVLSFLCIFSTHFNAYQPISGENHLVINGFSLYVTRNICD